jgi:hypothetical protein
VSRRVDGAAFSTSSRAAPPAGQGSCSGPGGDSDRRGSAAAIDRAPFRAVARRSSSAEALRQFFNFFFFRFFFHFFYF